MGVPLMGMWMAALVFPFVAGGGAPPANPAEPRGSLKIVWVEPSQAYCFFVGGATVDRASFCEALGSGTSSERLRESGQDLEGMRRIKETFCGMNFQSLETAPPEKCASSSKGDHSIAGRRLLLRGSAAAAAPASDVPTWRSSRTKEEASSEPEKVVLAASGMLLLFCAFMCPCFWPRGRNVAEQPVLGNDMVSMDSSSSFDTSSKSQKRAGTPRHVPPSPSRFSLSSEISPGPFHVNVNQIAKATHYFSESHKIGEGGFGTVYKAVLPDGRVVAVKRAKKEHFASLRTEFSNEVDLLAKIEHRSLVKLVDYIDQENEKIIITEYVPNGTLREHLDGQHGKILSFSERLEIAIDVAHGLTYLHLYAEKTIIHRDVKSSNILLTENLRAKVADFGFARTSPTDNDQTHISTKVKGTVGYLDPEYYRTYQLTPKSDVFSYGILLLEILSGRRPVDGKRPPSERITVKWAIKIFREGNVQDILDPLLSETLDGGVLRRILSLAFRCAANTRVNRPAMKEVVEELWEIRRAYTQSLNHD